MRSDRWLGPVIALLAVVWLALVFAYIPGARNETEPGPRAFPIVLGLTLLAVGALMSVSAFSASANEVGKDEAAKDEVRSVTRREATIVGSTFGLLLLYAFLMEKAGFLISTPIVVSLMMYGILRIRNWLLMFLMVAGITTFCWILFVKILGLPMPHGSWLWLL